MSLAGKVAEIAARQYEPATRHLSRADHDALVKASKRIVTLTWSLGGLASAWVVREVTLKVRDRRDGGGPAPHQPPARFPVPPSSESAPATDPDGGADREETAPDDAAHEMAERHEADEPTGD